MNIKKEREAFEKHASKFFITNEAFEDDGENYVYDEVKFMWDCWLAAKAQAVPEGFVLVPKEIPKSFDEGLYFYSNSISVVNEHSDGFIPMSDIDHSEIWKLVIEAQEPTND